MEPLCVHEALTISVQVCSCCYKMSKGLTFLETDRKPVMQFSRLPEKSWSLGILRLNFLSLGLGLGLEQLSLDYVTGSGGSGSGSGKKKKVRAG